MNNRPRYMHRIPAVVYPLNDWVGLQTSRVLCSRGVPVIGVAKDPHHFCCKTNTVQKVLTGNTECEGFVDTLESLGRTLGEKAVLFPCSDDTVSHTAAHRARLEPFFHVALPPAGVVELLMNKVSFYRYALQEHLPIPRTYLISTREDFERACTGISYPCILKPPKRTQLWWKVAKLKVYKVSDEREFREIYERVSPGADMLVAQEWIDGDDSDLYSSNCYFNAAGQPLVTFIARKLRQWPPEIGVTSLGEECRNDEVLEESIRLFKSQPYHGLGYLEMKRDRRTGDHFIIEANIGRPTGRSALAESCGVELLYTMYCDKAGFPLPEERVQQYRGGKWIYLLNDLRSAHASWKKGRLTLRGWLESMRGRKVDAVFSWSDLAPFIGNVRMFLLWGIRNKLRILRSRVSTGSRDPA